MTVVLSSFLVAACSGAPAPSSPPTTGVRFLEASPTCAALGLGTHAYRIEPVVSGTYPLDGALGGTNTVTLTLDAAGLYLAYASTLAVDAVVVKGGSNGHVYTYAYEVMHSAGLSAPVDWETGQPYPPAYVEFCFDYELRVTKTAQPSLTRRYVWAIEKTAPITTATLAPGQVLTVPYLVTLTNTGIEDSDWRLGGEVLIENPAPMPVTIESVVDRYGDVPVPLDCDVSFPFVLAGGASLTCTYDVALTGPVGGVNTVEVATTGIVAGGTASAPVSFGNPRIEWLDCRARAYDDRVGYLGEGCAPVEPLKFSYTLDVGPFEGCGEHVFENTARYVAEDTGTTGSSTWRITVTLPCPGGCTLTPGYWKNHSSYGPAPYDAAWGLLPLGADTPFFRSGQTYLQVLRTPPQGNVYYTLARAFIAAELNGLNGASSFPVGGALAEARALFLRYTPTAIAALKGRSGRVLRALFVALGATLDAYNNGLIGPGHCTDYTPPDPPPEPPAT